MKKKSGKKKRVNKKVQKIENGNKIYSILLLFLILLAGLLFETVKTKPVGASSEIYVSQLLVPLPRARDVPEREKSPLAASVNPGSKS